MKKDTRTWAEGTVETRLILKPAEPKRGKYPRWLGTALRRVPELRRSGYTTNPTGILMMNFTEAVSQHHWLDHCGTLEINGKSVFVSEPYGFHSETAAGLNRICPIAGLAWSVESNSWWYPGHTVRIILETIA